MWSVVWYTGWCMRRHHNVFITMMRTQDPPVNSLHDTYLKRNQNKPTIVKKDENQKTLLKMVTKITSII